MKILITNDDGIDSGSLRPLAVWAKKLGEVTVVAPKYEQSGRSHAINIIKPFEIKRFSYLPDIAFYSVDSTPADCVRFAFLGLKGNYDLVISGINRGFNVGEDIVYSGTVGAIFEAAYMKAKAVAVSTDPASFSDAANALDKVYGYFVSNRLFDVCGLYNVNIPCSDRGILITRQGGAYYRDEFIAGENDIYTQKSCPVYKNSNDLSLDSDAVACGYISVMPLTVDRTGKEAYGFLQKLNKQ